MLTLSKWYYWPTDNISSYFLNWFFLADFKLIIFLKVFYRLIYEVLKKINLVKMILLSKKCILNGVAHPKLKKKQNYQ